MLITRKIGSLIRGNATPFQIQAACLLGCLLGFLPGFEQAPGLVALWVALLLVLNANLFLAGIVALLSKFALLVTMPVLFQLGRALLDGPTSGIFRIIVNAPVTAYSGFDYYVVAGGQLVGLVVGITLGALLTKALYSYRKKMADLSENSERLKKYSQKKWAKIMTFVFLGSGKGKNSYESLMEKKMGNPIRIWGLALVLVAFVVAVAGVSWLSGPTLTSLVKAELEARNGATVDLESVNLLLGDGKLEVLGLAVTDPEKMNTNVFESKRIVADISVADLLRKRVSIDLLTVEDAATGKARVAEGEVAGPKKVAPKKKSPKSPAPIVGVPSDKVIGEVIENGDEWKDRLVQVKSWLEQMKSEEKGESWEDELNRRIQALGYAHVKADGLVSGSPTLWIRKFEAKGVGSPYLDNANFDIEGENLSSHPRLSEGEPTVSVVADNGRFNAKVTLGEASGAGSNELTVRLSKLPVDETVTAMKLAEKAPISGGSLDVKLSGTFGAADNDMVAQVAFDGTTAKIAGSQHDLSGQNLAINISGPLDKLDVKPDPEFVQRLVVSVGKKKLFGELGKKLGVDLGGDGDSKDGAGEKKKKPNVGGLLKGLLKDK